uniref:hypothetical protein n=1 Tax=Altererythrobacter segetis TaxID=1104773 RepID=UPI0014084A01|nr:hypothetical protein [Altererythrobacter segetis]
MPRPRSNVIPFRPRPRRWTRPEDYGGGGGPPRPPKGPKRDWTRLAAWALIAALVAGTAAYSLWG